MSKFLLGTRGSQLALTQSGMAGQRVAEAGGIEIDLVTVKTEGDILTGPLSQMGGTGVFAATLRTRLIEGEVDLAVHSLKDLPTAAVDELTIAAIPERADPRDALCARDGLTLDTLPTGARVGTGSPRRAAQVRAVRPDIEIVDIRGNVGTRLARVAGLEDYGIPGKVTGDCDAVVLAASGLERLGFTDVITEYLDPTRVLPAPGQGALALEIRTSDVAADNELARAVAAIDHLETRLAVTAERALLRRLEAGCAAPVGTYARIVEGQLVLEAVVANPDGSETIRHSAASDSLDVDQADRLGVHVAEDLLQMGAGDLAKLTL
ncbi:hydroxymethylbilane synthase [Rothia sp. LK2588]|uniref:hydroxymethylbilane synthase n=1 Tax=Rothia sp. LK2588 TaxID=3114369 RepID=UPI0034CF2DA1